MHPLYNHPMLIRRHVRMGFACLLPSLAAGAAFAAEPVSEPRFDHHVHVLGPGLVRDWKSLGVTFSRPDAHYVAADSVLGGEQPLEQALLVPMAHLYGNEELRLGLKLSLAEEQARTATENDHVAAEAARWPGRAAAFCSADWRRPYAREEFERCVTRWKSPGLKLHLASAGSDLQDAGQLAALRDLLGWAHARGLAVLVHFDPQRRGLDVPDVTRFAAEVLGPYPDLDVTIAHLGGSGGYRAWPRRVFGAFLDWLDAEKQAGRARSGVRFDVSAALLEKESEGVPATTDAEAAELGRDLLRAGPARLLFASDAPVFDPRTTWTQLATRTGLPAGFFVALRDRRAPVLERIAR